MVSAALRSRGLDLQPPDASAIGGGRQRSIFFMIDEIDHRDIREISSQIVPAFPSITRNKYTYVVGDIDGTRLCTRDHDCMMRYIRQLMSINIGPGVSCIDRAEYVAGTEVRNR